MLKKIAKILMINIFLFLSFTPAYGSDSRVRPGASFLEYFNEMPNAKYGGTPFVKIHIPNNFNFEDEFSAIFYMNGGNMPPIVYPSWTNREDFIWVGLPGFNSDFGANRSPVGVEDAEVAWPLFKTMIQRVESIIPNMSTNKQKRLIGGYSTGGQMTTGLLASSHSTEVLTFFNNFLFIDGGEDDFSAANNLLVENRASALFLENGNYRGTGGFPLSRSQKIDRPHLNILIADEFFSEHVNTFLTVEEPPTRINPSITFRNPRHNSSAYIGQALLLKPTANDINSNIQKVEFYKDDIKIGEDTTFPYQLSWTPDSLGSFLFHTRAIDTTGLTGTSVKQRVNVYEEILPGIEAEAEDGVRVGNLTPSTDTDGIVGIRLRDGFVPSGNDRVEITVDVPLPGYYKIRPRVYNNTPAYQMEVQVNSSEAVSWRVEEVDNYRELYVRDIDSTNDYLTYLSSGPNTISLTWLDEGSCIIDKITLELSDDASQVNNYSLTVSGGLGSGAYEAGEVVQIIADACLPDERFIAWEGDVASIENLSSMETTLVMPASDIRIEAKCGVNLFSLGDANLDGLIDGSDFSIWNENKYTTVPRGTRADFNHDGVVDGTDFNIWNTNRFTNALQRSIVPKVSQQPKVEIFKEKNSFLKKY